MFRLIQFYQWTVHCTVIKAVYFRFIVNLFHLVTYCPSPEFVIYVVGTTVWTASGDSRTNRSPRNQRDFSQPRRLLTFANIMMLPPNAHLNKNNVLPIVLGSCADTGRVLEHVEIWHLKCRKFLQFRLATPAQLARHEISASFSQRRLLLTFAK